MTCKRCAPLLCAFSLVLVALIACFPFASAAEYVSFLPSTTLTLEDVTDGQGFLSSSADFVPLQSFWTFPDIINGSEPVTFVVDGVSYDLYAVVEDGFLGFAHESFCVVSISDSDTVNFLLMSVEESVTLEIYVGVPPAAATRSLMGDLSAVAGAIVNFVSSIANTIVSTPLLLLTVGFFFGGGCVGIFGRILSKN